MKKNSNDSFYIAVALFACVLGWYFGFYKPQKENQRKNETCEIIAITAFANAFGKLEDIYKSCRSKQLQKIYAETKRKEGIEGASIEDHQKVDALCECAVRGLLKGIVEEWVGKCRADNGQWLQDSQELKKRFIREPKIKDALIESSYETCAMMYRRK